MKKTTDYLEEARKKMGGISWYQFAIESGITRSALTMYNKKNRVMDNYACTIVADILGVEPMQLITLAEMEREKDKEKKEFWSEKAQKYSEKSGLCVLC